MTLNEDNYVEIINGYTRADWQPLFKLIPELNMPPPVAK